jgi:cyclopropane fatty-acyl-phospholipid synthase-like methyltransferase
MSTRSDAPPERLVVAVDSLNVRPSDQILEIGCGRGVAAALICQRLDGGRLDALDRSTTAIAAATARNAESIAAGKVRFVAADIEEVDPAELGRYDKVLAVNVNLFWTQAAGRELRMIADLLRPGGELWLFYDPPGPERLARLETKLRDHLEQAGYRCTTTSHTLARSALLAVTALPHQNGEPTP